MNRGRMVHEYESTITSAIEHIFEWFSEASQQTRDDFVLVND